MIYTLRTLFRKWTPWEESLIQAFLPEIAPKYRETIQVQIDAVNKVHRLLGGLEINTYVMKKGKVDRTDIPKLFDDREFVLAKIETKKGNERIETQVFCVLGYFFSFVNTSKTNKLAYNRNLSISVLEIDKRFRMKNQHNQAVEVIRDSPASFPCQSFSAATLTSL